MKLDLLNNAHIDDLIKMENDSDTSEFIVLYNKDKHLAELENPLNRYLGIYRRRKLIGFILLGIEQEGLRIELRRIVISQKGFGFGQTAIKKLEEYCSVVWGTKSIWLDVFEFNYRGIHIYEKFGYRRIGESFYKEKKLIIMEKYL